MGRKVKSLKMPSEETGNSDAGHIVNKDVVKPNPAKQITLQHFPTPTNSKELRTFLGLAAYIGQKFVPTFTDLTSPLWELARTPDFQWNNSVQTAFNDAKLAISTIQPSTFFNKDGKITVRIDASRIGISGILCCDDNPVLCTSRKLSPVEQRYSQIEKEFLAIVYALHRLKTILFGLNFMVITDNKPLISFFRKKTDNMPLRIQRWMLSLQVFNFRLQHISGCDNKLADHFSRVPKDDADDASMSDAEQTIDTVCSVTQALRPTTTMQSEASSTDAAISELREAISTNCAKQVQVKCFLLYEKLIIHFE